MTIARRQMVYPRTRTILVGLFTIAALLASAPVWLQPGYLRLIAEILFVFTMAQMWNLLAGYVGLVSFGHQAFVGMGAYALFFISNRLGWSPFVCVPLAFLVCAIVAAVVAPFLFRLRDAYFSIAIWVLAEILHIVVSKSTALGSVYGLPLQAARSIDRNWFNWISYWWAIGLALGSILLMVGLLRSRFAFG